MTRQEAIEAAIADGEEDFTIILHRDYPGEHETDSCVCWCKPFLVNSRDPRTPEEVLKDVEAVERAEVLQ